MHLFKVTPLVLLVNLLFIVVVELFMIHREVTFLEASEPLNTSTRSLCSRVVVLPMLIWWMLFGIQVCSLIDPFNIPGHLAKGPRKGPHQKWW